MSKDIRYTSANLSDIKCLRQRIYNEIDELRVQKRTMDGKIGAMSEFIDALDKHIESIERRIKMSENKIIEMLGDIRYAMFDILELEGDELPRVLLVIDEKMDLYRSKSNEDIAKELIKND